MYKIESKSSLKYYFPKTITNIVVNFFPTPPSMCTYKERWVSGILCKTGSYQKAVSQSASFTQQNVENPLFRLLAIDLQNPFSRAEQDSILQWNT